MSEQTLPEKNYDTFKQFLILHFFFFFSSDSKVSFPGGVIFLAHATPVYPSPVSGKREVSALLDFAVDHCSTLLSLLGRKAI